MKIITVFYEDQLDAKANNFGPHILALACVSDALADRPIQWELQKHCIGVPKKGNGNVTKALARVADAEEGTVLALLDGDRIHELLGVPASTPRERVLELARTLAGPHPVLLLQQNIETIFRRGFLILNKQPAPAEKPSPFERDKVFQNLASGRPEDRRSLGESEPSWKAFIEVLTDLIRRAGLART